MVIHFPLFTAHTITWMVPKNRKQAGMANCVRLKMAASIACRQKFIQNGNPFLEMLRGMLEALATASQSYILTAVNNLELPINLNSETISMLTTRKMKKTSRLLTDFEKEMLVNILRSYSNTEEGNWLSWMPFASGCTYYWCDAMTTDSGILGARPLFGNDIYLAPEPSGSNNLEIVKSWLELIAPTAIHELRHMYQQKVYGKLLWSILRLPEVLPPLYGKCLIEKDALTIEERADDIILAEKHLKGVTK